MLSDRVIKVAHLYKKNELKICFLKKIISNKKIKDKKIKLLRIKAKVVGASLRKYQKPLRFRAFCNFTKKPRGVLRKFKVNSYFLKERDSSLYLHSLKRSSW